MMKKTLLILLTLVSFYCTSSAQKKVSLLQVSDSLETFKVASLPVNSLVFDVSENRIWKLTAKQISSDNLSTSSKVLVNAFSSLYNTDDTLTTDRILEGNLNDLYFTGLDSLLFSIDTGFTVNNNIAGDIKFNNLGSGDIELTTTSGNINLSSGPGNWDIAGAGTGMLTSTSLLTIGSSSNNVVMQTGGNGVAIGTSSVITNAKLTIEQPVGSFIPIAVYENQVGGAANGATLPIQFYFNDSNGDQTLGAEIVGKVQGTVGVGDVKTDVLINGNFKTTHTNRVLVTPGVSSPQPVAHFEIRGVAGVTTNTSLLVTGNGATGSQILFWLKNDAGGTDDDILQINGLGRTLFNVDNLPGADVVMEGDVTATGWTFDAGEEAVVMGGTNPDNASIFDMRSTTKGFLMPRMTTGQRDAIGSPPEGLMIINISIDKAQVFLDSDWKDMN